MGMAAGQARLLSITSRISDNELRAQLINNSKMRLATESSKTSEQYVTALNQARMMFTNYGPENAKSYQDLTFNSMTAYNQYNNQYGISSIGGQLLVSEKDATKFKSAQTEADPLKAFLKSYGLKYETTFFDENQLGKYMKDGQLKLGKYVAPDGTETQLYSTYKPEDYKAMYLGDIKYAEDGKTIVSGSHLGYDASFLSQTYIDYDKAIKGYNNSYDTLVNTLPIKNFVKTFGSDGQTLGDILGAVTGTSPEANAANLPVFEGYLDKTVNILGQLKGFAVNDSTDKNGNPTSLYYDNLIKNITNYKEKISDTTFEKIGNIINVDNPKDNETPFLQIIKDAVGNLSAKFVKNNADGSYSDVPLAIEKKPILDGNGNPVASGNSYSEELLTTTNPKTFTYIYHQYNADGNELPEEKYSEIYTVNDFGSAGKNPDITLKVIQPTVDGDTRAKEIKNYLSQMLTSYFATNKEQFDFIKLTDNMIGSDKISAAEKSKIQAAKDQYQKDAQVLAKIIFGDAEGGKISSKDYQNLIDLDWVEAHKPPYQKDFQAVIDITALEELFDVYGEPTYSWIKDGEPDKNANAEAKWYTNLYNRMKDGGYKVLEDGLASSKEWLQFALESGLVTMEQVDKKSNWTSTMYANCSDITEQTDNLAVTKAEAVYKQDMSKIENKDKRYDMELKNIDTEHNSLQTEYDSIKTAIDKNIERTFKIYT